MTPPPLAPLDHSTGDGTVVTCRAAGRRNGTLPGCGGSSPSRAAHDRNRARRPHHLLRDHRPARRGGALRRADAAQHLARDRKSVVLGKSVSVRVDLGGRSTIKKKNSKKTKPSLKN